eukprot:3107955-Prymnesium_polylepis.1
MQAPGALFGGFSDTQVDGQERHRRCHADEIQCAQMRFPPARSPPTDTHRARKQKNTQNTHTPPPGDAVRAPR